MTVKMRMQRAKSNIAGNRLSAFTLIEILCVVMILGICSAVIIPQISSRDDLRVAAAARVVMSDLMYVQNRAIATQKKHFVVFSGQTYTVQSRASDVSPLTTITHPITKGNYVSEFGTSASSANGMNLCTLGTSSVDILGFDELGAPFSYNAGTGASTSLSASATIPVTAGAKTLTISIEPFTGEASVN